MASSGMLRRLALVRTDVSEELGASIIRVTRIDEIRTQRASVASYGYVPSSPILVTPMMEALSSPERRFSLEPHGLTSQKTPFFIVTAVKSSKLTRIYGFEHPLLYTSCWPSAASAEQTQHKEPLKRRM
jgi:hypothetical protein